MKLLLMILFLKLFYAESKLVFPPNSDVGYILPDNEESDDKPYSLNSPEMLREAPSSLAGYLTPGFNQFLDYITSGKKIDQAENEIPEDIKDPNHVIKMGVKNSHCDDGVNGLSMDWNGSPENYTCPLNSAKLPVDVTLRPINECLPIHAYNQFHICMTHPIKYASNIPTFGSHRPLWPVYGEYRFLPPQRWLHSIEHGAIVMLYHPCADKKLVDHLRSIVQGCLYRHIITPHNGLSPERPLALAAWECKLEMASVDEKLVESFIKSKALRGPERNVDKNGQFTKELLTSASVVRGSDHKDSILCPK